MKFLLHSADKAGVQFPVSEYDLFLHFCASMAARPICFLLTE